MLRLQGQTPAPAKSQLHASTLLTWGGRGGSWINREGSAGWREECQRCWQLGRRYRSLWSTAAHPYCRLLAPHLHSYAAVFAHSRWLWLSCYMWRRCPMPVYFSANKGWCLMWTLWQGYSLPSAWVGCFLTLSCTYPCFKAKLWWLYVCSYAYIVQI